MSFAVRAHVRLSFRSSLVWDVLLSPSSRVSGTVPFTVILPSLELPVSPHWTKAANAWQCWHVLPYGSSAQQLARLPMAGPALVRAGTQPGGKGAYTGEAREFIGGEYGEGKPYTLDSRSRTCRPEHYRTSSALKGSLLT